MKTLRTNKKKNRCVNIQEALALYVFAAELRRIPRDWYRHYLLLRFVILVMPSRAEQRAAG